MNILELCLSPDLGGLELYALRSAKALAESDTVLAVVAQEARLKRYFQREGIPFLELGCRMRALPLLAARRLAAAFDAHGIDVVHIHWGKDLPLAALAKVFSRAKPRLVYTRQMQLTRSKDDVYHNFLYGQMDLMLSITEVLATSARSNLNRRDRDKVETLYYGVGAPSTPLIGEQKQALRRSWGIADDVFLVGLFGRIEAFKGQHLLIEAIARGRREGAAMAAIIVGHAMDSAYLDGLKQQVKAEGLSERVAFRDFVDNPQEWMQACDCVALTTEEETFGLVLVEAMRAGVAVVGSDRGGVPEIIDHGRTGLLFRSGDAGSLYEQLDSLRAAPALRARMAAAGKDKADRLFNERVHYERLREMFEGLVKENVR